MRRHLHIGFPRTRYGWAALMWLTLRRCPECHDRLLNDWPLYDDGETLWCLACGGRMLPRGFWRALRSNYGETFDRRRRRNDTEERPMDHERTPRTS